MKKRAIALTGVEAVKSQQWRGTVTPKTERKLFNTTGLRIRVLLDGVDVSRRCFRANDRKGFVMVYKEDAHGNIYIDPMRRDRAAYEVLRGHVTFEEYIPEGMSGD